MAELSPKERSDLEKMLDNISNHFGNFEQIIKQRSKVLDSALTARKVRIQP